MVDAAYQFQQHVLDVGAGSDALPWLALQRRAAAERFALQPLPLKGDELWKYTSLQGLYKQRPSLALVDHNTAQAVALPDTLDDSRLVFVDGRYAPQLSQIKKDDAVTVTPFSQANGEQQMQIVRKLGSHVVEARHWFAAWNTCQLLDGALISVHANMTSPMEIIHLHCQAETFSHARNLITVEAGARAQIVERFIDAAPGLQNAVCEIAVAEDAYLAYTRVALPEHAQHQLLGSVHAVLDARAQLFLRSFAVGAALHRQDVHCVLQGEQAHASLDGVMFCQGQDQLDTRLEVEHAKGHCTSDETWRGLAAGRGKVTFNGRIHIHEQAQKTAAQLSNKNLLLSDTAQINTKPELEIYADDVTCAHGATVGQLDPQQVFYLRSRGVSEQDALSMLSFGFINALVQAEPNAVLRDALEASLRTRFMTAAPGTGHGV